MTSLETYIQSYFKIPTENVSDVASLFEEEELKKGDFFAREDTYCQKMSFQTSGLLRVFKNVGDKEITQWINTEGHFITELPSFMFGQRARFQIQALSDSKLYTISRKGYLQLSTLIPQWPELEKQFLSACFITLEDRVFSHLSMSAEERYDLLFEKNKALFNQVPLQYIASMLGMTPETFSRIRSKRIS
ncbi:MAG: Crp/Fnr family transcriptional regulator [Crocinitomicaceae bacterium]